MNLNLKRVVRTPYSEEIAIFDANTRDEHEQAVNIGKLEVHYLSDQVVGTLLIWQEFATGYNRTHGPGSDETMDDLIGAILSEVTEPLGLPTEYGIEIYFPSITNHSFASNYTDDDEMGETGEGEEDTDDKDGADDQEADTNTRQPRDDDFYNKLTHNA